MSDKDDFIDIDAKIEKVFIELIDSYNDRIMKEFESSDEYKLLSEEHGKALITVSLPSIIVSNFVIFYCHKYHIPFLSLSDSIKNLISDIERMFKKNGRMPTREDLDGERINVTADISKGKVFH